jgi:hypothetical protein
MIRFVIGDTLFTNRSICSVLGYVVLDGDFRM